MVENWSGLGSSLGSMSVKPFYGHDVSFKNQLQLFKKPAEISHFEMTSLVFFTNGK